jgi:predicted membrane chloride channel (bestrophin family)
VPDWADAIQERRVRDRCPLYDHAAWREHRSSRRHLRHLLTSLSSRAILSLAPPVSAFTAFAAAIATYNTLLPAYALTASSLPYQLTAPALALLLVFRTEASYARFDEGRKAWMRVLAGAADLAGMVMHHPNHLHTRPGPGAGGRQADDPLRRALINYILAFPVALKVVLGLDRSDYYYYYYCPQPSHSGITNSTSDHLTTALLYSVDALTVFVCVHSSVSPALN